MVYTLTCPYANSITSEYCRVYANWVEQTGDNRLDIIIKEVGEYHCIVLEALFDFEAMGIPKGAEPEKRLKAENEADVKCSLIELLNAQVKILKMLGTEF